MKKNDKTNISDNKTTTSALVFDRIYGTGTTAAQVIAQRILIAAAVTFFSISYIFSTYSLPVNQTALSFIAAGASVLFSVLFSAVRKRIAIPVMIVTSGIVILWRFEPFWKRFSYFIDGIILECNGRIIDTVGSTIHRPFQIETNGELTSFYINGVVFGSVILCVIFALITSAGVMGKPHIVPSLSAFLLLWIPKLISEKLRFSWQLIPLVALYAGMIAIGSYYRDGLAIRHVYAAGGYRRKVAMDDRRFNAAVKAQNAGQRVVSRGLHYSKYFSSVMSAVAIFTVLGIVLGSVFKNSTGIDYDPFYEMLNRLGSGFGSSNSSPFKTGTEADYFTSPPGSIFKSNNRLRLTSPSTSTEEIIRVIKEPSKKPVYLRGDIGIDFDGSSWTSPVTDEPRDWRSSGLSSYMMPAEVVALAETFEKHNGHFADEIASFRDVSVEYLCDTDVIFAPAYDCSFGLFDMLYGSVNSNSPGVNIYGDFSFRRKTDKSKGETLEYYAAVPYYTDASDDDDISFLSYALNPLFFNITDINDINNILTDVNISFGRGYFQPDYSKYMKYVSDHYLGVPDKMKSELDVFIESSGLNEERENIKQRYEEQFGIWDHTSLTAEEINVYLNTLDHDEMMELLNASIVRNRGVNNEIVDRFLSAVAVSEYLKSNYTYSLEARIDRRDPVMSFLNNTKSGHCALYASAMTLILREWGIPARYCTGFVANADLSMVTLRSKDLHAWVEVYLDGMGWVTFDPTAGAAFGSPGGTDTSTSSETQSTSVSTPESSSTVQSDSSEAPQSSEPSSSRPDSSVSSDTHGSSSPSDPGEAFTFAQVLPYILIILAILAAIALIVLAVMAYIRLKKRAYKQLQSLHREKNSELVYEKLLAVLRFCKLTPAYGEQPHEFFERAEQTLECDICDSYGIFERLAFGETALDESERAQLGRSLDKIYKAAESKFWLLGRIRLRLLVLSKRI